MERNNKKIVLISGAASGIGKETVMLFLSKGYYVYAIDKNSDKLKESSVIFNKISNNFKTFSIDVANSSEIKSLTKTIENSDGKIDVLINNAGINIIGSVDQISEEDWDLVIKVNLTGVYLLSKYVLPLMIKNGYGSIVNISSISGIVCWPNYAAYSASKGGVISLTKQMAVDYSKYNIRVNCICPGSTKTPLLFNALGIQNDNFENSIKYKKEAEMHAEEDMRKKKLAETRNQADNLIYQARKILNEYKDKISEDLRINIENKIRELENAKNGEDINLIEEKIKELSMVLSQIGHQFHGKQEGQQI